MQVCQQVSHLLLRQYLAVPGHLIAPMADDIQDALVVGRKPAQREIRILEHSLQAGTFLALGGIRLMATVAPVVVDPASRRLLRSESQFGV